MKTMILGTGYIGRGSVSELLHASQIEITYFDTSSVMVDKLNGKEEYTIHVLGAEELNTRMEGVQAHLFYNIDTLCSCWKEAGFLFATYGGRNMGNARETLAKAFKRLVEESAAHASDVVTYENWINPTKDLREVIVSNLSEEGRKLFEGNVGVNEPVIICTGTEAPDPDKVTNEVDTWIQNMRCLPIDRDRIKGGIPQWDYMEFVTDFGDLLEQKAYTNNTSVAAISYLGKLKGLTYMAGSTDDPEIEPIPDQVYEEVNYTLIHGMGISEESQIKSSKTAKAKYTDRTIVNLTTHIARDPIHKLRPRNRFIGPMYIALSAGIRLGVVTLDTTAALYFDNPEDCDILRLKETRRTEGTDYILETVPEVDSQGEITVLIKEAIAKLKAKGQIEEGASA